MASKLPLPNDDNVAKAPASLRAAAGKTIEKINQELEQILLFPDSYIGSVAKHTQTLWVYEKKEMVYRSVTYVPGLYKIFDEILVRAADNKHRDPYSVKVVINVNKNQISICNSGVPLVIHQGEGVYVPEMIFGHLLTNDNVQKTTGGRNGYGAGLTNIFSTEFIIEIADGKRRKKYTQVFENNMGKKSEPVITKCDKSENWTKVTFKPDLKKFNMTELENDVVALMKKRVFDIAGCLGKTVKVELNGKRVPITDSDQKSIPSMFDGLKPMHRKILFCAFKTNLFMRANVYLFSCDVAGLSAYHHDVECLASAIISMAQDFVGSNNVNLLQPNGQFGTRTSGGKDAASPLYISTELSPATRVLFPKDDDVLLHYLTEDGKKIEPTWYMPIIPTVLVNGAYGIGTACSTSIPNYNPREIVANIRHLILDEPMVPMSPWFRGFKGSIEKSERGSYTTTGICKVVNETTLQITELPIGKWTDAYRKFLKSMKADNGLSFIQSIEQNDDDTSVDFYLILGEENMLAARQEGFLKKFKLTTTIDTSNMHLFNKEGVIKKYATPEEILQEFFHHRLEYYTKRKQIMLKNMSIKLRKLNKEAGDLELSVKDFTEILENAAEGTAYYNRCLKRSVDARKTLEKVRAQIDEIEEASKDLKKDTPKSLWLKDLKAFDMELDKLDKQEKEKLDEQEKEREVAQEKIRHAFEYYDKDETIVAHIAGGIDAVLKVPDGWPLRNTTLTLASLKNSDNQSKGISLSLICKVEEQANSLDLKTRQNLSSFIDAIEKILVQQTRDEPHSNEFSPKNITTVASNSAMDTAEVVKPEGRQGAKRKAPAAKEVEEDDTLDVKQGLAQYNFGSAPGDSSKTTETSKAISLDDDDEDVVVEVAPAKKGGRKPAASKAAKPPADPRKRGKQPMFLKSSSEEEEAGNSSSEISAKPPADPRKRGKQPMFLKSSSEEEEAGNSSSEISGDVFAEKSRPQIGGPQIDHVLSDSESESANDSEFDDIEDDEDDE